MLECRHTHSSWKNMMRRCYSTTHHKYPAYGAIGIKVHERWHTFANFYADMGPKPTPEHSIDRIENYYGYEPGNCKWSNRTEQNNNKWVSRSIEYKGKWVTVRDLINSSGSKVKANVIFQRIFNNGWDIDKALVVPAIVPKGKVVSDETRNKQKNARRSSRNAVRFDVYGQQLTAPEIIEKYPCVVDRLTLYKRLQRHWAIGDALNTPFQKSRYLRSI